MSHPSRYISRGSFQAHLAKVLPDAAVADKLEELQVTIDDLGEFALGEVAFAEVAVPPPKYLQREHLELYVKGMVGTRAQRFVEVAGGHQELQALVFGTDALLMVLGVSLRVDGQGFSKRTDQTQLFDEVNSVQQLLIQPFHHRSK